MSEQTLLQKIEDYAGKRCNTCPAFWQSRDHWGEWDAGCTLHRDIDEFCSLALLPKFIVVPLVKYHEYKEERYWKKESEKMLDNYMCHKCFVVIQEDEEMEYVKVNDEHYQYEVLCGNCYKREYGDLVKESESSE